jgi:hypothetical protein
MRIRRHAIAFAGLLVLAAGLAATPSPAPEGLPGSPFGEEIDVRVVNLEVVVTDRKGERVSGLAAARLHPVGGWQAGGGRVLQRDP